MSFPLQHWFLSDNPEKMKNGWFSRWRQLLSGNGKEESRSKILEFAFNCSTEGCIVYSKETQEILETNRTLTTLFDLPDHVTLKGLYISQVMMRYLTGESPNMDFLLNNLTEDWSGEAEFRTHTRNIFYGIVSTHLCSKPGETEEYVVMSMRNINERKIIAGELAKSRLRTEKAVQTKTHFLSSMSHELRTPLNGIIGSSDLILCEKGLSEEVQRHVQVIKYSSEHMLGIINDILSFSKLNADKTQLKNAPFDILKCLQNIASSFSAQFKSKRVEFIHDFPAQLENVILTSDELKLSQVIHNLISNALKFTDFGSVTFTVNVLEKTDEEVSLYFEIRDTGIGIAGDHQEEIFNAFSQVYADNLKRRYGGTGLGLAISRQMVHLFGGHLEVESELQQGSRFYFTCKFKIELPQAFKESEGPLMTNIENKDIRGIRVLVVEDNEINAKILKSFLSRWQMQIKAAITGVHAVELVKYHKFDLILMDLEMPEMNGYTALRIIREMNIDTPVIAFTATLLENPETLITEAGFTDYVVKPFRPDDLKRKIAMYCERKVDYA